MKLGGEEQYEPPLAQSAGHDAGTVLKTAVAGKLADLFAGNVGVAPALAAGDVDLKIGIGFVVLRVEAVVGVERGVHHVDKHVVAVHFGAAIRQGGKVVGL